MIRRLTSPPVGLYLLALLLAVVALVGLRTLPDGVVADVGWTLPLPVVALLFAFGDFFVLHLHVRRQRRSVSLSEVPVVLSLFLATPLVLLVGRLVGAALALVLYRKQRGIKLTLNLLMMAGEAVVAVHVFRALVGDATTGPWTWCAAYAAAAAVNLMSHLTVSVIIAMHEREVRPDDLLRAAVGGVGAGLAVATFGLLAETALREDVNTAFLLVVVTGLLVVGYRAYAALSERHLALERLHRAGQVLAASPETDELLRSLLEQARELLRALSAEVTFLPDGEGGRGVRVRLLPDGTLDRTVVEDLRADDPVTASVVDTGRPVLLQRGDDSAAGAYLEQRGQREAALVPLRGDVGVVGALSVADRAGEAGTFDRADLALLAKVGESGGTALVKGRQMDELRQGALHDALTGLPNRAQVLQVLDEACAAQDRSFTLFMLDLNGFKAVNDTLGHERGDVLLCDIARRLRAAVPPGVVVGRLGGDEFVVIAEVTDAGAAAALAQAVVDGVSHEVLEGGTVLPVGTALGFVVAPHDGCGGPELLRRADVAMYDGKRSRSGPTRWTPAMAEAAAVPSPREAVDRRSASGSRT